MSRAEFIPKADQLQTFISEIAEEVGQQTGFVQRQSKMTATCFVQTLLLGWLHDPEASLNQLVQASAEVGVVISAAGLHQRLNWAAVEFLQALVVRALAWFRQRCRLPANLLAPFSQVRLVDSSLVALPDALVEHFKGVRVQGSQAALKVQLCFDYLNGNLEAVQVVPGCVPDQTCTLLTAALLPNSLTIMDLGFFKKTAFEQIAAAGGFFLSRWQTQTALYAQPDAPQPLDLLTCLRSAASDLDEIQGYLKAGQAVKVRLIYARLPPEVVAQRRRKAKAKARRRGENCSARHLELLAWALVITNVPTQDLSGEQLLLLYRVRWQIELVFKLWKSQARLDGVGNWRIQRVLCQFYGRRLGLIVFHWIVIPYRCLEPGEVSLPKAFQVLQRHSLRLIDAMANHWRGVAHLLAKIAQDFRRFARKHHRRKSPSTYQRLLFSGA